MRRSLLPSLLLLMVGGLLIVTNGFAQIIPRVQDVKITFTLKNNSLLEAFEKIEEKTPFRFNYSKYDINEKLKLSLRYQNTSLGQILLDLAKLGDLTFKQVNLSVNAKRRKQAGDSALTILINP